MYFLLHHNPESHCRNEEYKRGLRRIGGTLTRTAHITIHRDAHRPDNNKISAVSAFLCLPIPKLPILH